MPTRLNLDDLRASPTAKAEGCSEHNLDFHSFYLNVSKRFVLVTGWSSLWVTNITLTHAINKQNVLVSAYAGVNYEPWHLLIKSGSETGLVSTPVLIVLSNKRKK